MPRVKRSKLVLPKQPTALSDLDQGEGEKGHGRTKASLSDVHLASTVQGSMSKGRAGKRHITMLLNGLHVNNFSQALKMSFVLRVGRQKERGRGAIGQDSWRRSFYWLDRMELAPRAREPEQMDRRLPGTSLRSGVMSFPIESTVPGSSWVTQGVFLELT